MHTLLLRVERFSVCAVPTLPARPFGKRLLLLSLHQPVWLFALFRPSAPPFLPLRLHCSRYRRSTAPHPLRSQTTTSTPLLPQNQSLRFHRLVPFYPDSPKNHDPRSLLRDPPILQISGKSLFDLPWPSSLLKDSPLRHKSFCRRTSTRTCVLELPSSTTKPGPRNRQKRQATGGRHSVQVSRAGTKAPRPPFHFSSSSQYSVPRVERLQLMSRFS